MKKILLYAVLVIVVIAGIGVGAYPFLSDYFNSLNSHSAVMQYLSLSSQDHNDFTEELEAARKYNKTLLETSSVVNDPFSASRKEAEDYRSLLSIEDSDIMATIEIKAIDVNLPIYHGTDDSVLEKGVGHLSSSSLPVGGKGTHAVITGHTGYSAMKLFTDINKLVVGDVFTINVCGEVLSYKVDNIATVLPHETDLLQIDPEQDYVTMITCTPFGVNSHRLLVRGVRVSNEEAEEIISSMPESTESTWTSEYLYAIIIGGAVMIAILVLFFGTKLIIRLCRKKKYE